jgi:murein DD-endopeptidase MepM/ murein hydrolase activator NlpD
VNPPGTPDACKPAANGGCCLQHPSGVVTQPFTACGGGGSHYGVDYGTAIGTPISAGMSGTVVGSALGYPNCWNNGCSGACWSSFNYVKLKADCGDPKDASRDLFVYYLHIDSLAPGVGNGTHVDQGQLVAFSGNSGCSSGPHIHLETASVPKGQGAVLNTCASVDPSSRFCP